MPDQHHNTVGGDLVGRDKISYHFHGATTSESLVELFERLCRELQDDDTTNVILPELLRFQEPSNPLTRSLEQKLKDSNRADLTSSAIFAKESFTKKLAQFSLFESAQEIHAFALSRIYSRFTHEIRPLIASGADRASTEEKVRTLIIEPIVAQLNLPPCRYYDEDVYGMIYYLAEKCHLSWD